MLMKVVVGILLFAVVALILVGSFAGAISALKKPLPKDEENDENASPR